MPPASAGGSWQDVIASNGKQQTVFVVDDDAGIRNAMQALLDVDGKHCVAVGTADELLAALDPAACGCIVLDIRLPGMGGLELQDELQRRGSALPIIFITGHADVALAVTAMRKGAFDFLEKPFDDDRLLACVGSAFEVSAARMAHHEIEQATEEHYRQLTDREREVLDLVVTGKPNKVIAYALGVSQRTVEIHRSRVMKKMRARSLADLVKMHLRLTGDTP